MKLTVDNEFSHCYNELTLNRWALTVKEKIN